MSNNVSTTAATQSGDDERRIIHVNHDELKLGDIAIGVVIGRASEYFNFFLFGIAAVLVFPSVIFPFVSPTLGTIYSFIIFSFAFIARPIGTQVFSILHRRYGRGTKLTLAIFLLGTATVGIALTPSYASVGVGAIIALAALRIAQGFAIGGAWDGLPSLLALSVPENKRGTYAMIPQLSAPIGFLIAAGLFAYLMMVLPHDQFIDWGWRYPFFAAFVLNVVALFARMRLVASKNCTEELEEYQLKPAPLGKLIRHHGRTVFLGSLAPLASYALFHLVTIFSLSWAILFTEQTAVHFLLVEIIGGAIAFVCMIISGKMADWIGRRKALGTMAVLIAIFSGCTPIMLSSGLVGGYLFILIGFALLGFSHALSSGALASGFPHAYRYSGAAFTADLSWLFGAAFAPLVALLLAIEFGVGYVGLYLLSGAIATIAVLWINRLFQDRTD